MRHTAPLRGVLVTASLLVFQGQQGAPSCGAGDPTPGSVTCEGNTQLVRVVPGALAPLVKCGASGAESNYETTKYVANAMGDQIPSWVAFGATDVLAVGAMADAAIGSRSMVEMEVKSAAGDVTDHVSVDVMVIAPPAPVWIEPSDGVSTDDATQVVWAHADAPFSLQAKVARTVEVGETFTWTWGLATSPERERLETDSRASFQLPRGRYTVDVQLSSGEKSAGFEVFVTEAATPTVFGRSRECTAAEEAEVWTPCDTLPNGESTTGAEFRCVAVTPIILGGQATATVEFTAQSNIPELQFGNVNGAYRYPKSSRSHLSAGFCLYTAAAQPEVVTVEASIQVNTGSWLERLTISGD